MPREKEAYRDNVERIKLMYWTIVKRVDTKK